MENIRGEFKINLAGKERTMKASFDVIERLESGILRKPVFETLGEATQGRIAVREMAALFHVALSANGDNRLSQKEVGEALLDGGAVNYVGLYIEFLTYLMTGGREPKGGTPGEA